MEINVKTIMVRAKEPEYGGSVKLLAASQCIETGEKVASFELKIPRIILAELNTHRVRSSNTASSRAIPILKFIASVAKNPFYPLFFGENKSGMSSSTEMPWHKRVQAKMWWSIHRRISLFIAKRLLGVGLHKQWTSRLYEAHMYVTVLYTATDWDNFFDLRVDDAAQPEIVATAGLMQEILHDPQLEYRQVSNTNPHNANNWHYVFITDAERYEHQHNPLFLAKLDAARCARTSYLTEDRLEPDVERDMKTFGMLTGRKLHASPLEHPCVPCAGQHGNFKGFKQFRQVWENQNG